MGESNIAVVRRAVEMVWNRGELNMAEGLFGSTYVNHGGLIPDVVVGPEAIKVSVAMYRTAFPQLCITIDRLAADGDMVDLAWEARGTLYPASQVRGRSDDSETLTGTTRSQISNGRIVESWTTWDREGVLRRLESSRPTVDGAADGYPGRRNSESPDDFN